MKRCAKCGEIKPIDLFKRYSARGKIGVRSACKSCSNLYQKQFLEANGESKKHQQDLQRKYRNEGMYKEQFDAAYFREAQARYRTTLAPNYVKRLLSLDGVSRASIPESLVGAKRVQMQIARFLKEKRNDNDF